MHAISSYHGNRPTHTPTNRQDQLQYTVPQLACSVMSNKVHTRPYAVEKLKDETVAKDF